MQQNYIFVNMFQQHMCTKFNVDINSASAIMSNVRGKENLVYEYIRDIASLFQPVQYGQANPMGLYSDYDSFKKHFVKYWKNALDFSRDDIEKLKDIFDEEVSNQESCIKRVITSVFFENGKALTIDDCLNAIYEVFKIA